MSPRTGVIAFSTAVLFLNGYAAAFSYTISVRDGEADEEAMKVMMQVVLLIARTYSLVGVLAAASGLFGVLRDQLLALRVFALHALADTIVAGLVTFSFALLSFSPALGASFGRALCQSITSGERSNSQDFMAWGFPTFDGLENCEERWRLAGLLFMLCAIIGLGLRAHLVQVTWQYYRHQQKRRSLFGKKQPLLVSIPSSRPPSIDLKPRSSRLRSQSNDMYTGKSPHSHHFATVSGLATTPPTSSAPRFMLASPYTLSPTSSPRPDGTSTTAFAEHTVSRRYTHSHQPSESHVLVYVPTSYVPAYVSIEDYRRSLEEHDSARPGSIRSIRSTIDQSPTRQPSAFSALKGDRSSSETASTAATSNEKV